MRKKRVVLNQQEVIDYIVRHPKADSRQVANRFGMHRRTAQKHINRIKRLDE